jgi:hypothetical protein
MKDAKAWIERFRVEAEECRLISKLATNQAKREVFARLAEAADRNAEQMAALLASGELSKPSVSADAKVAHCAEVNLTHLGNNGGFARAVDVEPGASSGDTSFGPSWVWSARDSAAVRLFAEYGEAVPSGPKGRSLRPACPAVDQTGGVQGLSA